MFKKGLKRKVTAAVTALCILGMTACGGGKEEKGENSADKSNKADNTSNTFEAGVYTFEEKELFPGTDNQESYISQFYLKEKELYFMYYVYPEYPEEYYDDLEKLDEKLNNADSGVMPLDEDIKDNSDDTPTSDTAETGAKDKSAADNPDDISDDELTGDIDDLFGDDAKATDKPDDGDKPDDDSQGTELESYEDLEEKYKDYKTIVKMCRYNIETGETADIIDYTGNQNGSISSYFVDDENHIVMLYEVYEGDDFKELGQESVKYRIIVKGADGKDISDTDVTDKIKTGAQGNASDDAYINFCKFGPDGYLYISYTQGESNKSSVTKLKTDGTVEGNVLIEEYVDNMVVDNQGNIIVSFYDKDGIVNSYLDFEKGTLGEKLKGFDDGVTGNIMSGYGDITLFVRDSNSLYAYDGESGERTMILKWLESGLVGDNVNELFPLGDGSLFITYNDNSGKSKVGVLSKSDDGAADKKVVKLGAVYTNSDIQESIIAFNKLNDEYKIEYVSYENQENPETAFANDIIAGNIPDIMDVSSVDKDNYINKGMLEDLTPYLEKDDTVNKDYFVDGVLDATSVDGKLYYLFKNFSIMTVVGKGADLKEYKDGWTVQEMIDYYKSKPKGTELFEHATKNGVFYELIGSDLSNYIDWKTGEVRFDSDEFKKLLEFCNTFPEELDEGEESKTYKKIKEGKLLLNSAYIGELAEFQIYRKLFDDDVRYIGYPASDKNGTYMNIANEGLAITTSSENKDAAWEFIKFMMTQKDNYWSGIPASKVHFEDMVKRKTTTEKYVDESGETVEPVDDTYGWNDLEVKVTPSSQEDVQMLKDLINQSKVVSGSYDIASMIDEEVNKYFEGSKTLDDIVKIVQDKISKYVNENK